MQSDNTSTDVNDTRDIIQELFINAPPDQVWQAFTQAEHIENWFAASAQSEPGVGGFIDLLWDRAKPENTQHCVITQWEPEQRLVMSWRDAPDGEHPLPIEVILIAQDGGTLFRLTHSGFLSDASWDEEFESHARGWTYELKSFRHYLEYAFGQRRTLLLDRIPMQQDWQAQWAQLVGPHGLIRVAENLADATEVVLGLPTGEESRARVLNALTRKDFAAVVDALQGGVIRLTFETFAGGPELWFWTSSWQLDETQLRSVVQPWYDKVRTTFTE